MWGKASVKRKMAVDEALSCRWWLRGIITLYAFIPRGNHAIFRRLTCSWGIVADFFGRLSEGMAFAVGEPKRIHGIDEATSMK